MTRIVVAAKQDKILLQDTQSNKILMTQPAIIQVGVKKEDVQSISKEGNNLLIQLKNGEQIVLENFYPENGVTQNSLAFPEPDGKFAVANFNEQGKFTNYSGLDKLEGLLYENTNTGVVGQVVAYQAPEAASDFSFSNLFSSNLVKAGLAVLGAAGLGIALLDSNDSSTSGEPDIVVPTTPTAGLSADGLTISGTSEAGTTVYFMNQDQKVLGSVKADAAGKYSFKMDAALTDGKIIAVYAKDAAGNESKAVGLTGTIDTIAPAEPQAQLSEDGKFVTGKAEANAKINVYDETGKLVGSSVANASGDFSVTLSTPLTSAEGGKVVAEDQAGNKSTEHKIVVGQDTIAPAQPSQFEVNADGTLVHGVTEANAKVLIKDSSGSTVIGTATADANGSFSVTISPAIAKDKTAQLILEDAAGNQSSPVNIKQAQDNLAPEKPTATINNSGNEVTGTAEANSTVTIKTTDGKTTLGTVTVDATGHYTLKLDKPITDSTNVNVTATDKAGNISDVFVLVGSIIDTMAPPAPTLTEVKDAVGATQGSVSSGGNTDDYRPKISGKGEGGATLTIYDNGKAVSAVTVAMDGTWSYTPGKDLTLGEHSLTVIQSDQTGNTSPYSAAFNFKVVEQIATPSAASLVHSASEDASLVTTDQTENSPSPTALSLVNPTESTIVDVLQNIQTTDLTQQTEAVQEPAALSMNDLQMTSSVQNTAVVDHAIESAIQDYSDTKATTDPVVASVQAVATNANSTHDIPVVQSDVITGLLLQNPTIF